MKVGIACPSKSVPHLIPRETQTVKHHERDALNKRRGWSNLRKVPFVSLNSPSGRVPAYRWFGHLSPGRGRIVLRQGWSRRAIPAESAGDFQRRSGGLCCASTLRLFPGKPLACSANYQGLESFESVSFRVLVRDGRTGIRRLVRGLSQPGKGTGKLGRTLASVLGGALWAQP